MPRRLKVSQPHQRHFGLIGLLTEQLAMTPAYATHLIEMGNADNHHVLIAHISKYVYHSRSIYISGRTRTVQDSEYISTRRPRITDRIPTSSRRNMSRLRTLRWNPRLTVKPDFLAFRIRSTSSQGLVQTLKLLQVTVLFPLCPYLDPQCWNIFGVAQNPPNSNAPPI